MMRNRASWLPALVLAVVLAWPGSLAAQYTEPPGPAAYALQNVTVVQADGSRMDSVTLVIRGGMIESMGPGVPVPGDAKLLEGDSLYVYPGLIDAQGVEVYEFPEIEIDRSEIRSWDPPRNAQTFMPHRRVVDYLTASGADLADQRTKGVVAAAMVPGDRLMPGSGAVLAFRADAATPEELVVHPVTGPAMYFRGAQGAYPATLFAVIAFYRQTFEDARHYQAHAQAYERGTSGVKPAGIDPDLDVMLKLMAGEETAFFVVDFGRDIQRVLGLSEEYGFRPIIVGGDEAWKVADELSAARVPVLVSLDFPEPERWEPSDEEDNGDGEMDATAQREKIRIENIYANAGKLEAAEVTFALTSGGGDADLLEGARKAIEYGLSEAAALRALTSTPAAILGLERMTGIERGSAATFIVTDGPLFAEETNIRYTFVEGGMEKGKEARGGGEAPAVDVSGSWDLTIEAEGEAIQAKLELEQEGADVTGTMVSPFGEATVSRGTVSGYDMELTIVLNMGGESMEIEITGTVEGDSASGSGDSPMASFTWTAKRAGGPGEETDR
jgi:hypothetical protein